MAPHHRRMRRPASSRQGARGAVSFDATEAPRLDGLPVERVQSSAGRVDLFTPEPEALLRALFERGLDVRNLEVTGATLEEAVIGLTSGRNG